jgi:hypothetical protein
VRQNLPNSIVFDPADTNEFIRQVKSYTFPPFNRDVFIEQYARKNIIRQMAQTIIKTIDVNPQKDDLVFVSE